MESCIVDYFSKELHSVAAEWMNALSFQLLYETL